MIDDSGMMISDGFDRSGDVDDGRGDGDNVGSTRKKMKEG